MNHAGHTRARGWHPADGGAAGLADESSRVLPDPVEYNFAERFLAESGVTKDDLISRMGGSP